VLVALPLSYLDLALARAALMAIGIGFLTWALTRRAWWPLTALAGGQVFVAVQSVQWAPLLAAGMALAPLQYLWSIKPPTGLALFAAYPNRRTVIGGLVLFGLAFVVWPHWLDGWLAAAHRAPHRVAVLRPGGVLLLLALLRWRLPEGRLLATLALVPLTPHLYEAVPLLLVARSRRELLALAACGTIGLVAVAVLPQGPDPDHGPIAWMEILVSCYLPALLVILKHPNVPVGLLAPFEAIPSAPERMAVKQ
jgi:SAM-dependent methyltransferase